MGPLPYCPCKFPEKRNTPARPSLAQSKKKTAEAVFFLFNCFSSPLPVSYTHLNKLALEFADSYSLMTSSGSDYHMREDVARGGIMVPDHIASMADLVAYLKERRHPELIITFDDKGKR